MLANQPEIITRKSQHNTEPTDDIYGDLLQARHQGETSTIPFTLVTSSDRDRIIGATLHMEKKSEI